MPLDSAAFKLASIQTSTESTAADLFVFRLFVFFLFCHLTHACIYLYCASAGSCDGGSAEGAFAFAQNGIPESTCLQYDANDDACSAINTCRNCVGPPGSGTCFAQANYTSFYVDEYSDISGVSNIMAEIYARGPGHNTTHTFTLRWEQPVDPCDAYISLLL